MSFKLTPRSRHFAYVSQNLGTYLMASLLCLMRADRLRAAVVRPAVAARNVIFYFLLSLVTHLCFIYFMGVFWHEVKLCVLFFIRCDRASVEGCFTHYSEQRDYREIVQQAKLNFKSN